MSLAGPHRARFAHDRMVGFAALLLAIPGCLRAPARSPDPAAERRPAPTPQEIAAFHEALARCQSDDDCADLAKAYENGTGTEPDEEARRAALLKACLGFDESVCSGTAFMSRGVAAPGTAKMLERYCAREPEAFSCDEIETARREEKNASRDVWHACDRMRVMPADSPPAEIGPLVDRCPGYATPEQRARARLFRSERAIADAYEEALHGTPAQMRRFYERLAPLGDLRADEVLALGKERFGQPVSESLREAQQRVTAISSSPVDFQLCTLHDGTAYVAEDDSQVARSFALRIIAHVLVPPTLLLYLPGEPLTPEQEKQLDQASRAEALRIRNELQQATGASKFVPLSSCKDVDWFRERAGNLPAAPDGSAQQ